MNHVTPTVDIHCYRYRPAMKFFAKAFSIMLLLAFLVQFSAMAQGARPSCNISGPLEAVASGADIIINVEVARSTANPNLVYSFSSNTSGATIKSKGPVVYNAAKNIATQQVTITPGTRGGAEFNLKLKVTTAGGTSECSKSVSVSQ